MIDDSDDVLRDPYGARLVEKILSKGGAVGVSLVAVIRDIYGLGANETLLRALVSVENKAAYMRDGNYVLADLAATYGSPRPHTIGDSTVATFVLHLGPTDMTLGLLAAVFDGNLGLIEAQRCAQDAVNIHVGTQPWAMVADDAHSWWTFDAISAQRWYLRRHQDGWALINIITNMPVFDSTTQKDAIRWADVQIDARFEVSLRQWQLGPCTGEPGLVALYADAREIPVVKDTSDRIMELITRLY